MASVALPSPADMYMPIETLLREIENDSLVTWMMDQFGILRAVFKVASYEDPEIDDSFDAGSARCRIRRKDYRDFRVDIETAIRQESFEDIASIHHLQDGTAVLVIINEENGTLTCYYLCFEDMGDEADEEFFRKFRECRLDAEGEDFSTNVEEPEATTCRRRKTWANKEK